MRNRVIDFKYANEEQKNFLKYLESNQNIECPNETLNVPMWLVLALHSKLSGVLNTSKLHKFWDKSEINRTHLIEEFGDLLSHIANLANFLELDLVTDISEIQETDFGKISVLEIKTDDKLPFHITVRGKDFLF